MSKVDTTNENLKVTYVEALDAAKSGKAKTVSRLSLTQTILPQLMTTQYFLLGGASAQVIAHSYK